MLWTELNKDSNRLEGVRTETIVHRAKDVAKLQEELKAMGEDEDFEFEYEDDDDDDLIMNTRKKIGTKKRNETADIR